jgi:hypothetical protein
MSTCHHSVERLAYALVGWMSPLAKTQARTVPQGTLGALEDRLDLRAVDQVGHRVCGRPHAFERVRDRLTHPASDLSQGVGQIGVPPRLGHVPIVALSRSGSQGAFNQLSGRRAARRRMRS